MESSSKTRTALALVAKGMTPYAAAKEAGVSPSAVYAAMKRQEGKETCPCCGQIVREGFTVKRAALKKS